MLIVPQGYVSDTALSDSATHNNATFVSLGLTPGNVQGDLGHRSRSKFHDRRRSGPAARCPFTLRHRPRCIRSTRLAQEAEGSHGRCLIRRRTKIGFHPARAVPCSRIFHKSAGMYIERNIGPLQPHVGTSLRWSTLKGRFTRLDWEGPVWRRSRLFSGRILEPLLSNCRN